MNVVTLICYPERLEKVRRKKISGSNGQSCDQRRLKILLSTHTLYQLS